MRNHEMISTSRLVIGFRLSLTLLAASGFYLGFRALQQVMASPVLEAPSPASETSQVAGASAFRAQRPPIVPWPKYPGAKEKHVYTATSLNGESVIQVLEALAAPEKVMQWYRRRLSTRGWTTQVSGQDPNVGFLSAPASMLKANPEVFQKEKVLRMIDTLHRKMLIMRRKQAIIVVTARPAQGHGRQEIRLFWYKTNGEKNSKLSGYERRHLPPALPFRRQFGDETYESTFIASHLSPDSYLAEWNVRLRKEGWEPLAGSRDLAINHPNFDTRVAAFTRGEEGAMVMIQPGPENGSLGLVTRMGR
jgi:hypothetical protein